jgi:hypothetical protein
MVPWRNSAPALDPDGVKTVGLRQRAPMALGDRLHQDHIRVDTQRRQTGSEHEVWGGGGVEARTSRSCASCPVMMTPL